MAHVVARGEFGHDAAVATVHLGLAHESLPDDPRAFRIDRKAGLVARGLDTQHPHVNASSPIAARIHRQANPPPPQAAAERGDTLCGRMTRHI